MKQLANAPITTILPVKDMDRARMFYNKTLGLEPKGFSADGNYFFECGGGVHIALIPKSEGTKAEHTALSFEVQEIEGYIEELQQKGVQFEEYDLPDLKTVDKICVLGSEKAA